MLRLTKIHGDKMNVPEPVFLPTKASETYIEGETLVLSSGTLTKASGAQKPKYVAAKGYIAPASNQIDLPVFPINDRQVWEVSVDFSAEPIALVVGTKVTLSPSGLGVTDVVTDGVASIVDKLSANNTDGEKILVMFD